MKCRHGIQSGLSSENLPCDHSISIIKLIYFQFIISKSITLAGWPCDKAVFTILEDTGPIPPVFHTSSTSSFSFQFFQFFPYFQFFIPPVFQSGRIIKHYPSTILNPIMGIGQPLITSINGPCQIQNSLCAAGWPSGNVLACDTGGPGLASRVRHLLKSFWGARAGLEIPFLHHPVPLHGMGAALDWN